MIAAPWEPASTKVQHNLTTCRGRKRTPKSILSVHFAGIRTNLVRLMKVNAWVERIDCVASKGSMCQFMLPEKSLNSAGDFFHVCFESKVRLF